VTSGIRVGTPAITSRGFKETEITQLTGWMCDVMDDVENQDVIAEVKAKVLELCARFPVYPES
jgi:glycine hydroxymethyltransferase